jgi:hypothetical protein
MAMAPTCSADTAAGHGVLPCRDAALVDVAAPLHLASPGCGHFNEARAELSTAVAMLREMGMAFWLPEAENELASTAPPSAGTVV